MSTNKNKKNVLTSTSIIFLIMWIIFGIFTVIRHNNKLKKQADMMSISCGIYSIKNNEYPNSLDELNDKGTIQLTADELQNYRYELNNETNKGKITVNLWLAESYSTLCQ